MEPEKRLFSDRALAALLIPLLLEQVLNNVVGVADTMMISGVGEAAVSGVSLIDSVVVLLLLLFNSLGAGGAVVAGQYLGQRAHETARHAGNQLLLFVAGAGVVCMVLLFAIDNWMLRSLFGSIEPEVEAAARIYMDIVWFSVPAIALFGGGAALLRAMGDAQSSLLCSLAMNVFNLTGNAVLIYGLRMGVAGAAIPTVLGRWLAAGLVLYRLRDRRHPLHLDRTDFAGVDLPCIRKILMIGVPNGLEGAMFQLGKLCTVSVVATMGTAALAASAVGAGLSTFQVLPGIAIGMGLVTVTAQCVGAGDFEQARFYTRRLMKLTYVILFFINIALYLALNPILGLYHLSPEAFAIAREILIVHGIASVLIWPLAFTLPNTLRAAGDVKFVMISSIISMWTLRVGGAYLLARITTWGAVGVYHAMNADWVFRLFCFVPRYLGTKWYRYRITK